MTNWLKRTPPSVASFSLTLYARKFRQATLGNWWWWGEGNVRGEVVVGYRRNVAMLALAYAIIPKKS